MLGPWIMFILVALQTYTVGVVANRGSPRVFEEDGVFGLLEGQACTKQRAMVNVVAADRELGE